MCRVTWSDIRPNRKTVITELPTLHFFTLINSSLVTVLVTVKSRKEAPGLNFGGAYIRRGLSMEGNLPFKIDWTSLKVERKFTAFALFYFVFEDNFQVQAPGRAYIWR